MTDTYLFSAILTMAAVTYVPRMLPLVLVRGRIENHFLRSFLYYVPYAVLASMTLPAIFLATDSPVSAGVGLAVALVLGLNGRSLILVALGSAAAVWMTEQILSLIQ